MDILQTQSLKLKKKNSGRDNEATLHVSSFFLQFDTSFLIFNPWFKLRAFTGEIDPAQVES